jgi:hypothetical protein
MSSKMLQSAFVTGLVDFIERDLLPLKNQRRREHSEPEFSAAKFRKAFQPSFIEVAASGSYEWIFDDGGLFMGHDVVVRGSFKSGPKSADVHG